MYKSIFGALALVLSLQAQAAVTLPVDQVRTALAKVAKDTRAVAAVLPINLNAPAAAGWAIEGNEAVWRESLTLPGASTVAIFAPRASLPAGGLIKISGATAKWGYGPEDLADGKLWTRPMDGNTLHLEIRVPKGKQSSVQFHATSADAGVYQYRAEQRAQAKSAKAAGECEDTVNFECLRGPSNTDAAQSTLLLNFRFPDRVNFCTGNLVNNTNQDGRPFILSATHCEDDASNLPSERKVFWNASAPCGTDPLMSAGTYATAESSGMSIRVTWGDVRLYELGAAVPKNAVAYWAGWDARYGTTTSGGRTGLTGQFYTVHHAGQFPKLYTRDVDDFVESQVNFNMEYQRADVPGCTRASGTFCSAVRAESNLYDGSGATFPGASGSALFNSSNRSVGVLAAGDGHLCGESGTRPPAGIYQTLNSAFIGGNTTDTSLRMWLAPNANPANSPTFLAGARHGDRPNVDVNLTASPSTAALNAPVTLTWTTRDVRTTAFDKCKLTAGSAAAEDVADSGSKSVTSATAGKVTYRLACPYAAEGGRAVQDDTVEVTYGSAAAPNVTLVGSPTTVKQGETSTLTWNATDATSCTASGAWSGSRATNGNATVTPAVGSNTYTLTCTGTGGSKAASTTVTATAATAPTVSLDAAPTSIKLGQSTTLTWSSTDATSCSASGNWSGSRATSGSASVSPTTAGSKGYTLTCTGAGGSKSATTSVYVSDTPAAPVVTISTSPSSVSVNQASTLTWSTTGANACTASGSWAGSRATSGSLPLNTGSAGTQVYSLSCSGEGGTTNASATLQVTAPPGSPTVSLTATPGTVNGGQSSTLSWSSTNATDCNAFGNWGGARGTSGTEVVTPAADGVSTYRLSCSGPGGSSTSVVNVTRVAAVPPTMAFRVLGGTSLRVGSSVLLDWQTTGYDSCEASGAWSGTVGPTGQQNVNVSEVGTKSYGLTCSGPSGTDTRSVSITGTKASGGGAATPLILLPLLMLAAIRRRSLRGGASAETVGK